MTDRETRITSLIKWTSAILIVVSLLVLVRVLPVGRGIEALTAWIDGLSFWGPAVYGLLYVTCTVLFIPGSALTLGAGAIFGLGWGTVSVSLGSTAGAALAFLIARHVARDKIAVQARRFPKFDAIDRAIGRQGWKIIALLRLSPVVPFNLSNYLFGLTAIRFWSYVLASWLAMLPGTFMYIYLGHLGRESLAAAADAPSSKGAGEWALLVVGLIATVVVTIFVARLARRAIQEHTQIGSDAPTAGAPEAGQAEQSRPPSRPWAVAVTPLMAVVAVGAASCAHMNRDALRGLFGPTEVTLAETYAAGGGADGPTFDHSQFDALLRDHVDADGWIDYRGLAEAPERLDQYIASLADAPFEELGRDEKLALLINAYNAFTLRLILDHRPVDSIRDIPAEERWDAQRWDLAGDTVSLNQIEHERIRPNFVEPRVHFALVCAAVGCPILRGEAYTADRLEEQLADQNRYVHSHDRWFRFEPEESVVHLTALYNWYGGDFEQVAGSVLEYAARHAPALREALDAGNEVTIRWLDYDWSLNSRENAR
jgi:uncharacterized membrane protein YdjX (TVP38/TMEM64 family)